jgi:hypothetical protein
MAGTGKRTTRKHRSRPAPQTGQLPGLEDSDLRAMCRALGFWRVCGKPACRRALDCKSDAQACFRRFWPEIPEASKVWIRAAIRASAEGLGRKAAAIAADAEAMRWEELQARFAPKAAAPEFSERASETVEAAAMPRVRSL